MLRRGSLLQDFRCTIYSRRICWGMGLCMETPHALGGQSVKIGRQGVSIPVTGKVAVHVFRSKPQNVRAVGGKLPLGQVANRTFDAAQACYFVMADGELIAQKTVPIRQTDRGGLDRKQSREREFA